MMVKVVLLVALGTLITLISKRVWSGEKRRE